MKIQIISNVMVMGTPVFTHQKTGSGKSEEEDPTIIDIEKKLAVELIRSQQAKPAVKGAQVNFEIEPLEKEDDPFDSFFEDEFEEETEE